MTKYRKITDISFVTDTTSIYQKNRYLKCRYVPIPIYRYRRYIDDSSIYRPTCILGHEVVVVAVDFELLVNNAGHIHAIRCR